MGCTYVLYCLAFYVVPLILFLLMLLAWHIRRMRKKYEHIPGPPVDNFILGNMPWFTKQFEEGNIFSDVVHELIENYGPATKMFFLWKPMVFTIDQAGIKLEGKVLLARLTQTFDLTLDPEYGDVQVTEDHTTNRPAGGVKCYVKARKD